MRDEGGGLSRGRPERTHLPAIIFALRIIIASPSRGVSVMALGVGALTISALQAFKGLPRGAEAQADGVDAPRSGSPGVAGKAARRPLVVGLGDRRERAADADLSSIDLSRG